MKKYLQICFGFLLFAFILSCNEQKKTEASKVSELETKQAELNPSEMGPYFIESDTITSAYGPNSITRNILQDKKGNVWFATWEGIIRYDGQTFTNFTNKEGLRRFHVFSLMEDTTGNIWFGTIGAGLYRYDGKSFTNLTTKEGLVNDSVGCIIEDKNGAIWIGTAGGVSKYEGNSFSNFSINGGQNNNDVNSIVEDNAGKLWIGTRGDAFTYDRKKFTKITNEEGQAFVNVRSILEDIEGTIWLGGNDGLWSYDGSSFTNFTNNFVGYIYQDSGENIWTSSAADGNSMNWVLSKYDKIAQIKKGATTLQIKNEENMFFGITEDKKGGIWLGTLRGVYRYDGLLFKSFTDNRN